LSFLPIEGSLSIKPLTNIAGSLSSSEPPESGVLRSGVGQLVGPSAGETSDSPESSAIAELSGLISSLGSLSAQAQVLPLTPPTLPGLPQGGYQAAPTDYMQFAQDAD
jgi:hypothetical protein